MYIAKGISHDSSPYEGMWESWVFQMTRINAKKKSTLWSSKCFGIVNCHCELKLHARIIIKTTWPKILFYQHKIPYSSWWSRSLEKYISKFGIYKYFIVFIFRLKICIFVYRCTVTAIHNLHAAGKHFSYNKFNQI